MFFRWIFQRTRPSYFSIFFESLRQTQTFLSEWEHVNTKCRQVGVCLALGDQSEDLGFVFQNQIVGGKKKKKHLKKKLCMKGRGRNRALQPISAQGDFRYLSRTFFFFFFYPRRMFPIDRRCSGVSVSPVLLCFRSCILSQSSSCGMLAYTLTNGVSGNWWRRRRRANWLTECRMATRTLSFCLVEWIWLIVVRAIFHYFRYLVYLPPELRMV